MISLCLLLTLSPLQSNHLIDTLEGPCPIKLYIQNRCKSTPPLSLSDAVMQLIEGTEGGFFNQELIAHLRDLENDHDQGDYFEYWDNGNRKIQFAHKKGLADGHIHGWYPEGSEAFVGFFREGVRVGAHITFSLPRPQCEEGLKLRIFNYNEEGKADKAQEICYPRGTSHAIASYKNGLLDGSFIILNSDLEREELLYYKNGLLIEKKEEEKPSFFRRLIQKMTQASAS